MNIHLHFILDQKKILLYRTQPIVSILWKWKIGRDKQGPCLCGNRAVLSVPEGAAGKAPLFV